MPGRSDRDAKAEALRKHRALNPTPERVRDERFQLDDFFDPRDLVQVKYEMLRRVRREGATVTEAARAFGFSRPTFYRAQQALEEEGLVGLAGKRPGPRGAHKLGEEVMAFVDRLRAEAPELRSRELAHRIQERFGVSVHSRSIERALARREKKPRSRAEGAPGGGPGLGGALRGTPGPCAGRGPPRLRPPGAGGAAAPGGSGLVGRRGLFAAGGGAPHRTRAGDPDA